MNHRAYGIPITQIIKRDPIINGPSLRPQCHKHTLSTPHLAHSQQASAFSEPVRFSAVAPRYPELPILMGHSGLWTSGFAPAAEAAARCPNLVLETCGSRMTARHLLRLVAETGAERIAFGSDAVFLDLRVGLGRVLLAGHDEADRGGASVRW